MRILIFALFPMFLLSACNKQEEMVIFDITIKNQDSSLVTNGFVRINGYKPTISGGVTLYENELPLSNEGKIHLEIPFNPKITEFIITYWNNINNSPTAQTVTGCNHEFDPHTCELSDGQRVFEIEIIVL